MHPRYLLIALLLLTGSVQADTVTYQLTITNNWTGPTHPGGYPDNAHFSWLGGGTHAGPANFWSLGGTATPGFEVLAESGDTSAWIDELAAAGAAPLEWRHWFCEPRQPHPNCGSLRVSFTVSSENPYLTLASMLGPSPDWFVGVQDLLLRPDGEWASGITIPLALYDAGTEAGTSPVLDNLPTDEPIGYLTFDPNTREYIPTDTPHYVGQLSISLMTSTPTDATQLISATASGQGANGTSWDPAISADGQLIAFSSDATTLVANELNGSVRDVFLFDRTTGVMRNLTNGGNGTSEDPVLSKDGRWLAFVTNATNLPTNVPDTNGDVADIVLANVSTGELRLVTAGANAPSRSPAISRTGRQVVFDTQATNLAFSNYLPQGCATDPTSATLPCYNNVLHYDQDRDVTVVLTQGGTTDSFAPSISESGMWASYISGGFGGVIAMNLDTGERQAVPLNLPLNTLNFSRPAISPNGRWLAIHSAPAGEPTVLHLYDLDNNRAIDLGEGSQLPGEFSSNERYLVYSSTASAADGSDTNGNIRDIFRVDLNLSVPRSRRFTAGGNAGSGGPVIGREGTVVVWDSQASNFVDDFNGDLFDVFLRQVSAEPDNSNVRPIVEDLTLTVNEGNQLEVTFNGIDPEGKRIEYTVVSGPSNGVISPVPDEFAPRVIYTPNPDFVGTDSLTYVANDGIRTSLPGTITIEVIAVNTEPVAVAQSLTTTSNTPLAITLTGTDVDGDELVFAIATLPSNGTLNGTSPTLRYTSASGFTGTDSFTFTVNDGVASSAVAKISIVVSAPTQQEPGPNDNPPVANAQSLSTPQQTPLAIELTGASAVGDTLTFGFVALPANGSLSGQAPNIEYTPDIGFSGEDSFSFSVTDGQGSSAPVTVSIRVTDPDVALLAAVLPASRSVEVGTTATAFATLINVGSTIAQGCELVPPDTLVADFFYQATDSGTNETIGQPNLPAAITSGGSQSFVFGITPTEEMPATDVALEFRCANSTGAASFVGLNTLLLSASQTPGPDLIALASTLSNNGVMEMTANNGFFTAATINVGSTAAITATADTGNASLPMTLSLCETDPVTSICINPTQPSTEPVVVEIAQGASPTFAVFASATDLIALDPAQARVFLRFSDEQGRVKGATSVAVQSR